MEILVKHIEITPKKGHVATMEISRGVKLTTDALTIIASSTVGLHPNSEVDVLDFIWHYPAYISLHLESTLSGSFNVGYANITGGLILYGNALSNSLFTTGKALCQVFNYSSSMTSVNLLDIKFDKAMPNIEECALQEVQQHLRDNTLEVEIILDEFACFNVRNTYIIIPSISANAIRKRALGTCKRLNSA